MKIILQPNRFIRSQIPGCKKIFNSLVNDLDGKIQDHTRPSAHTKILKLQEIILKILKKETQLTQIHHF